MNSLVLAQEATGSALPSLIFLALMIGVFYFLIIRPQRKRSKAQQELADSVAVGQEIRTVGGIYGKIVSIDDESVVLRVEDGQIRIARRAVGARVGEEDQT